MTPTQDFLLRGNKVEYISREMLKLEPEERCFWFDAVYDSEFDATLFRVSLSKVLHKFNLKSFLYQTEWSGLDYDNDENAVNLDDLSILEQNEGLL